MRFVVDAFSKFNEERWGLAYYISTAMIVGGVLLTNDRRMAENARGSGVDVYYILKESNAFFKLREVGE